MVVVTRVTVGVPGPTVVVEAGVTVTARGVATFPGQQPATAAVAWACAWVIGAAQPASTGRASITMMDNDNRTIDLNDETETRMLDAPNPASPIAGAMQSLAGAYTAPRPYLRELLRTWRSIASAVPSEVLGMEMHRCAPRPNP